MTTQAVGTKTVTHKQKSLGKRIAEHWVLYLFLLPAILAVALFHYRPMLESFLLAFKKFQFKKTVFQMQSVGFQNFQTFFDTPNCWQLIKNTLTISLMKIILGYPFPILLAVFLNESKNVKFKKTMQTISYLPHFLSWAIVVTMIQRLFAPNTGIVNQLIAALGGDGSTFWMMQESFFYPIMFWSNVWMGIGWGSIIYLAAITGVDPTLYEVAHIDGATKWQEVWYVTLPSIIPVMTITFILSLSGVLSAGYDQIYMLRTPGNMDVADILDTYIIRIGLEKGKYTYATAIGLIQGLAGLVLVIITNTISKAVTENSLW